MKIQLSFPHWIIIILLSAVALSMAGVAWWYEMKNAENISTDLRSEIPSEVNSQIVTIPGQSFDDHGCNIPEGYYWCELSQSCINHAYSDCEVIMQPSVSDDSATNTNVNAEPGNINTNSIINQRPKVEAITTEQGLIEMEITAAGVSDTSWLVGGKDGKLAYYSDGQWIDLSSQISGEINDISAIGWNAEYWLVAAGQKIYTYNGEKVILRTEALNNGIETVNSITWAGRYWILSGKGTSFVAYDDTFTLSNPIGIVESTAYSIVHKGNIFITAKSRMYDVKDYQIIVTSLLYDQEVVNALSDGKRKYACGLELMQTDLNGKQTTTAKVWEAQVPSPPGLFELNLPQNRAVCGQWMDSYMIVGTEESGASSRYWKIDAPNTTYSEVDYSVQGTFTNEVGTILKTSDGWIIAGNQELDGKKQGVILRYVE